MEKQEGDEEKKTSDYFHRLIYLVIDLGTEVLLKLFLKNISQGQTLKAFINSKASVLSSLKNKKVFNDSQLEILNAASPDVSRFDISLLYILISNLTNIQPPTGGWYIACPLPSDQSAGALLMKLRRVRNEAIAHRPNSMMTKSDFEQYWNDARNILIELAGEVSQAEKDHVKEKIDTTKAKQLVIYKSNSLEALYQWERQDQNCEILSSLNELHKKSDQQGTVIGYIHSSIQAIEARITTKSDQQCSAIGDSKSSIQKIKAQITTKTVSQKTVKKLENEEWFHGVLPRKEVQQLLVNKGDFLVRESKQKCTNETQYVLSAYWQAYRHFIIKFRRKGWMFEGPGFQTISELVNHQFQGGQPVTNKSGTILQNPIAREYWELNNDDIYLGTKLGNTVSQKTVKKLENEEWFHGVLPREEVQQLLVNEGDFLVRESKQKCTKETQYVLSAYWQGYRHFIIKFRRKGWMFEGPGFQTISELVNHQFQGGQPVTNKSGTILQNPIAREYWELNNDDIYLGTKIGNGSFGEEVFKGVYTRTNEVVVVKVCRDILSKEKRTKFLMEGLKLKQYDHPNIVKCIGIAAMRQPVMIIMEYVAGGPLLSFLREIGTTQSRLRATQMCVDAACGMAYLSDNSCILRDLAARNCLVGNRNVIKISDFRMSLEQEESMPDGMESIPIKWTAPEALYYGGHTIACDVWSYGILMWEIFSNGQKPYPHWTEAIASERVEQGYRLPAPANTPDSVYQLMRKCWDHNPHTRITIHELHKSLKAIVDSPPKGENFG